MDQKDETIIRTLERNARLSSRALAKIVGLPISTVYRRVRKLEREGIITGYKALINYEKTETPICAFVFVNLAEVIPEIGHIPKANIVSELRRFGEIQELFDVQAAVSPNFDLMMKVRLKSLKALSDLMENLRSLKGIEEVSSAIITEEITPF